MQADDVATVTPTSPDTETSNISFMNETISSLSSFDIDDFLLTNLGPKQLPLNWLIPLTVVYSIIFLTGIVGNVCTCLVIARNQYMQTATNCYLFNLAIADMLTLFFEEKSGRVLFQKASRAPASISEIRKLEENVDSELLRQGAREMGLCDIRRALYDDMFEELIRQETVTCPERGRLLKMVEIELDESLASVQTCYESSLTYGIKKKLEARQEMERISSEITRLLSENARVADVIKDLEAKFDETKQSVEKEEIVAENECKEVEDAIRKENKMLEAKIMEQVDLATSLDD